MQDGQNARQQIVERIRQATSILVAVGQNPSVDSLSAALGLSLMLNKMNKHTTAVFSGQTPPAIQFLEPNKLFESNVDALRDFIISLDKEKADRLRYKVEDDVVRIFITPYKTSLSDKDLQFSQGDFNVDLIIALGVEKREELDKAIIAHGRILHDATVMTINANNQHSTLGAIDWNDAAASSLCEMLVGMSEVFQQPGLLDAQISTALLTGIVAATERFSNNQTSPRVMTMAAQLMAAGANQQLIATNLTKAHEIPESTQPPVAKQQASAPQPMQQEPPKPKKDGELDILHDKKAEPTKQSTPTPALVEPKPAEPAPQAKPSQPSTADEEALAAALPAAASPAPSLDSIKHELAAAAENPADEGKDHPAPGSESVNAEPAEKQPDQEDEDYISSHGSWKGKRLEPPTLGGTLNATAEEALKDEEEAQEKDRNNMLLTHTEAEPVPEPKEERDDKRKKSRRSRGGDRGKKSDSPALTQNPAPIVAAEKPAPTPPAAPALTTPPTPPLVEPKPAEPAPTMEPMPPLPEPPSAPISPLPPVSSTNDVTPSEPKTPSVLPLPPLPPMPPAPEPSSIAPSAPTATEPQLPPQPTPLTPSATPVPTPAPAPTSTPLPPLPAAPVPEPEPDLEALKQSAAEAAAAAQPSDEVNADLHNARKDVTAALDAQPFNPAGQPQQSVGAQPLPPMPNVPITEPNGTNINAQAGPQPPLPSDIPPLPPLPPMPPMPQSDGTLPPAPNLPGLNEPLPPITNDEPTQPSSDQSAPKPGDPGQFKIPGA